MQSDLSGMRLFGLKSEQRKSDGGAGVRRALLRRKASEEVTNPTAMKRTVPLRNSRKEDVITSQAWSRKIHCPDSSELSNGSTHSGPGPGSEPDTSAFFSFLFLCLLWTGVHSRNLVNSSNKKWRNSDFESTFCFLFV